METEQKLIKLILINQIQKIFYCAKLEGNSNFILSRDIKNLQGIWELRWSSSNAPFLNILH